jgi:hypothetical protein
MGIGSPVLLLVVPLEVSRLLHTLSSCGPASIEPFIIFVAASVVVPFREGSFVRSSNERVFWPSEVQENLLTALLGSALLASHFC